MDSHAGVLIEQRGRRQDKTQIVRCCEPRKGRDTIERVTVVFVLAVQKDDSGALAIA